MEELQLAEVATPRAGTPLGTPRADGAHRKEQYEDPDAPLARSDRSLEDYVIGKQAR